jgi:hypothetical protein
MAKSNDRHLATRTTLHGEAAARVDWARSGEVVPARLLAERWGLSPQGLESATERGELFVVVIGRRRHYPKEFLEVSGEEVSAVSSALGRLSPEEKLIFWKRPHGALAGKTVVDALKSTTGPRLPLVVQLARSWAVQAEADAERPDVSGPATAHC